MTPSSCVASAVHEVGSMARVQGTEPASFDGAAPLDQINPRLAAASCLKVLERGSYVCGQVGGSTR